NLPAAALVVGTGIALVGSIAFARGGKSMIPLTRTLAIGILCLVPVVGTILLPVIDAEKSDRVIANLLLDRGAREVKTPVGFLLYSREAVRFYSDLECRELRKTSELADAMNKGEFDYAIIDAEKWDDLESLLPPGAHAGPVGKGRMKDLYLVV